MVKVLHPDLRSKLFPCTSVIADERFMGLSALAHRRS